MLETFSLPAVAGAPTDLHEWTVVPLPAVPNTDHKAGSGLNASLKVYRRCSKSPTHGEVIKCELLPYGFQYHRYHRLNKQYPENVFGNYMSVMEQIKQRQLEEESKKDEEYAQQQRGDRFEDLYEDKESNSLLRLDPTKWKDQDHYKVLGLGRMRWKATDEDIKRAYRKKVLKHHPDKKQVKLPGGDNYFKCVQKAYEFLSDASNRRQYDSIDPAFDSLIPRALDNEDFFATFGPIFARYAHFSKRHPVPSLGSDATSKEQVESFYQFWTSFESWRSFELLDEEPIGETENRDERRYLERQNKAERARRKKEETAKLIRLVDAAIKYDPRLARFRDEEKQARDAKKLQREQMMRQAEEEAKKAAEEARLSRERQEALDRETKENEKKAREQQKRQLKLYRKQIRTAVSEIHGSFDGQVAELTKRLDALLTFVADDLSHLQYLAETLPAKSAADARQIFDEELAKMEEAQEEQRLADQRQKVQREAELRLQQEEQQRQQANQKIAWAEDELKLLVKAVNMFPGGTVRRWETIGEYLAQHSSNHSVRQPEELIKKSTEIRKGKVPMGGDKATKKKDVVIDDQPTVRLDHDDDGTRSGDASATASSSDAREQLPVPQTVQESKPWTAAEQTLLEKALRAYPSAGPNAYTGADRWDKVAEMVPGRSKKEIVARIKEVMKAIKAKKSG